MGDEVLKTLILLTLSLIISSAFLFAKDEVSSKTDEYDKLFTQISKKRIGASSQDINKVENPFIMERNIVIDVNSSTAKAQTIYKLNAIFDKKAKINGQWYKLNSEIDNFNLASIGKNSVIIKNEHSKKELFIRKSDDNKIKFSSK
jgi:hypothetical protein